MTDRKKPGIAFWASVDLVVVLVGYPLSYTPACRFADQIGADWARSAVGIFYWPLEEFGYWLSNKIFGH